MATRKLYNDDAYVHQFHATVVSVSGKEVILDATAFYPSGGGQVCDTGDVEGVRVLSAKKAGEDIVHEMETDPSFAFGQRVSCAIDWTRRYRTMRLHSAAHIVFYAMQGVFGAQPASSGLVDDQKDRNDYLFDSAIDRQKLKSVEDQVNTIITRGYPVKMWQEGETRYWKIEQYPAMKCAGTHVRNTSEIGPVRVERGKKPGKGKERIETSLLSP